MNVQKFLIGEQRSAWDEADLSDRYHYKAEDIVMLTDNARNQRQLPTRANMIQAMNWLVSGAQPNDALFFH
jgi:hypothetical protein